MAVQVSYEIPEGLPDAGSLLTAGQRLARIPEAADREEAFQTLFKLVHGILGAPEDARKRRVRKSNEAFHRKLGRFAAGLDFLRGCGFVDDDGARAEGEEAQAQAQEPTLSMPIAFMARLTDAHHTLAKLAQQAGMSAPPLPGGSSFNPYQSNLQTTEGDAAAGKTSSAWRRESDQIREEVKRRRREMDEKVEQAPPVDLKPSSFWLSAGRRLEEVAREAAAQEEDRAADAALLQAQVAGAKASISGASQKFESADKKRLTELRGKRVYELCVLRVICPDKSVLQVHFRSADRGERVLAQLAPLLAPHVREAGWYIYQSPPLRKLAPQETLAAAGFTPGANLYLGFDGQKPAPPYLEDSLVAQLGPPPDGQRGVGATAPASAAVSGGAVDSGTGHTPGSA